MSDHTILYLSRQDVADAGPSMADIIAALDDAFRQKGEGGVDMPPKPGIHPRPEAFIHAMPAYLPQLDAAGIKWVAGYPSNRQRGLPYVSGLLILNDPETGLPTTVMDATWITGMRTGAATALAAKYLARSDAETAGILACGVQGRSNLEALACAFDLQHVKAFDTDPQAAHEMADELSAALGLEIEVVSQPRDAVVGLDLVVTSGPIRKDPRPAIEPGWLAAGAFACALDFDSYWQGAALREADKLATDDLQQLAYYRGAGYFRNTPEPYADLGEIVSGQRPGRESADERIICINLGLALEDMVTAVLIADRAERRGVGRRLPL
ncbi:MAG: ornithine cyclodeaminase family protein [Gemmatimonadota bacterium]|nr:MAG: ornithine cyclodeaminase family protein [Gemmatimonadota bacterium]